MTLKVRLPRLPHLPEYKSDQNQVDEYDTRKTYEKDLHRALSEGELIVEDAAGGGGGFVTNVSGTAPITVTNGSTAPVVAISTFVASGASHARGAVPDPGVTGGTTKFLREDATWQVPAGGGTTGSAIVMAKVFGRM